MEGQNSASSMSNQKSGAKESTQRLIKVKGPFIPLRKVHIVPLFLSAHPDMAVNPQIVFFTCALTHSL